MTPGRTMEQQVKPTKPGRLEPGEGRDDAIRYKLRVIRPRKGQGDGDVKRRWRRWTVENISSRDTDIPKGGAMSI